MRTRTFNLVAMLLLAASGACAQQDSLTMPRLEMRGAFQYSANSAPGTSPYRGESRSYAWAFQPGVGVFVTGMLAIDMEFRFQQTTSEVDYPGSQWDTRRTERAINEEIFIATGPCYNVAIGSRVWAFASVKIGLMWSGSLQQTSYAWGTPHDNPLTWAPTNIVFPMLQAGMKLFVVPQAFVMLAMQYDRLSEVERKTTTVAMGLGVML